MIKHKQTLAVIVPAHNEERNLKGCLESLLNQYVPVDEIIVISNNSTDKTTEIAKSFNNVKVLEVSEKSLINARDIGFNYSKCDILARINADVICEPKWSDILHKDFSDSNVSAVAGVAKTWTMIFMPNFLTTFWSRVYLNFVEAYFGVPIMWGSNMALRRSSWDKIKMSTCKNDGDVHEDQDISIHLSYIGERTIKNTNLIVINREESYFNWPKLNYYNSLRKKTKKTHSLLIADSKIRINIFRRTIKMVLVVLPGALFGITSVFYKTTCLMMKYLSDRRR